MADRTTSIRHLRHETDTAAHVDALVQQRLTRALAHESRRRRTRASGRRRSDNDTSRSTR